mmetsp:Transcript_101467/g.287315  ORF Transcript_101467/g.287315 Transcript_101467/m.287315 type:complete len:379 (-) Transcript_101467:1156-2292(-)
MSKLTASPILLGSERARRAAAAPSGEAAGDSSSMNVFLVSRPPQTRPEGDRAGSQTREAAASSRSGDPCGLGGAPPGKNSMWHGRSGLPRSEVLPATPGDARGEASGLWTTAGSRNSGNSSGSGPYVPLAHRRRVTSPATPGDASGVCAASGDPASSGSSSGMPSGKNCRLHGSPAQRRTVASPGTPGERMGVMSGSQLPARDRGLESSRSSASPSAHGKNSRRGWPKPQSSSEGAGRKSASEIAVPLPPAADSPGGVDIRLLASEIVVPPPVSSLHVSSSTRMLCASEILTPLGRLKALSEPLTGRLSDNRSVGLPRHADEPGDLRGGLASRSPAVLPLEGAGEGWQLPEALDGVGPRPRAPSGGAPPLGGDTGTTT